MERSIVSKSIAGSLSQQPLFDPYIPFDNSQKMSTIRNVSFSSYTTKPDDQLNNQVDDSEISIFDARKYFNESGPCESKVGKRVSPVNAANVINLERISDFSTSVPRFSSASSVDRYGVSKGNGRSYRARSFHATPTASSEASWNSQTGLLSNPSDAIAVSIRNPAPTSDDPIKKKSGSAKKWLFRRRCPCSGKKSVQVEEKLTEPPPRTPSVANHSSKVCLNVKTQTERINSVAGATPEWLERRVEVGPKSSHKTISAENKLFPLGVGHHRVVATATPFSTEGSGTSGFTFPILNQTTSPPVKLVLNNGLVPSTDYNRSLGDPPWDSLEVFRPSDGDPNILPSKSDHQRQSSTFPASPRSRKMTIIDDDIASDASSDLFEIESFSTSTQTTSYPTMHSVRRDSLDEASSFNARRLLAANGGGGGILFCRQSLEEPTTPSIAATECYEPSEASIDWSIVTAEGFDKGSVTNFSVTASEMDELTTMQHHHHQESERNSGGCSSGGGGGGGGGKRRGGNGVGLLSCHCEKAVSVGPHPVKCMAPEGQRLTSSTLKHVSSRPPLVNKPPLARSHSARVSIPFPT